MRQRLSQTFYEDRIEPVTPAELAASHSHGEHDAIEPTGDHARPSWPAPWAAVSTWSIRRMRRPPTGGITDPEQELTVESGGSP